MLPTTPASAVTTCATVTVSVSLAQVRLSASIYTYAAFGIGPLRLAPTWETLNRYARATGTRLRIELEQEKRNRRLTHGLGDDSSSIGVLG